MKLPELLFALSVSFCTARSSRLDVGSEAEGGNATGGSNLTRIPMENWRASVMEEVKELLLKHHNTVLPDYSRIGPMSDSLRSLEQELAATRRELAEVKVTLGIFRALLFPGRNRTLTAPRTKTYRTRIRRPVIGTGRTRTRIRKKFRVPRLRLPAATAQRNFSPRVRGCVPASFLYSIVIAIVSLGIGAS